MKSIFLVSKSNCQFFCLFVFIQLRVINHSEVFFSLIKKIPLFAGASYLLNVMSVPSLELFIALILMCYLNVYCTNS